MKLGILLKQDIKNLITNPVTILFCFVYPLALIFLFGTIFSDGYGGSGITSYDFYGVTMMFYIVLACATITPNVFMEERVRQGNIRIAYSPVSRVTIYASKLIATFLFMGITFCIDMCFLNFSGITNFGGHNFFYLLFLLLLFLAFTITLGGVVCVLIKSQDWTNKIVGVIANTLAIASRNFLSYCYFRRMGR